MAERPVFISNNNPNKPVIKKYVNFEWHPGFSKKQKQKSIASLHKNFLSKDEHSDYKVLEVSTKSPDTLGVKLSAFNLEIEYKEKTVTVEKLFQASKVFENGGPYKDLLDKSSQEAKTDERIKDSGKLIAFQYKNEEWPLEPKTLFYDWIYMKALSQKPELAEEALKFDAFTDIEFNPKKSINCQAKSLALYSSLEKTGMLNELLNDSKKYINHMKSKHKSNNQLELF